MEAFAIRDGDEVHIFPIAPFNQDAVYLQGHVLRPGRYSFRAGMRLADIVSSYADLLPEPAAKYAEIVRLNPPDYRPSVESFELAAALANPAAAPKLQPLDTVRIFSRYDFENPPAVWVGGEVRSPGAYRTSGQVHLRDAVYLAGGITPDALLDTAQLFRILPDGALKILSVNLQQALVDNPVDNILLQPRDRILVHRNPARVDPPSVFVKGEVPKPGRYPLTLNLRVEDLIRLAGGLKRSAYPESADLTRYGTQDVRERIGEHREIHIAAALAGDPNHNLPLRDGDVLTIRQLSGWNDMGASVTVQGEVEHPGVYGIRPGERLSSVLKRAGGFRPTAYPQAAVLTRAEVRQLQEKSRQELIQRVEQEASAMKVSFTESAKEQAELHQAALQQRQRVVEGLRKAPVTGRLVINLRSNLADFESSPDDIEVRAEDALFIPKRPGFVVVTGQVYNSNAISFEPRKTAGWYLQRSGGATNLADKRAIFVVRANGAVVSGKGEGWWGGNVLSARVEPGDTVVVPEKAIGGSPFWKNVLGVAQIAQTASIAALVATR
ncbi:MAG: SLBB domain-containing protein [Acidobacteria bacterium]|nr:SLBB domain-containing protein [Acidobacteriota bacterium]